MRATATSTGLALFQPGSLGGVERLKVDDCRKVVRKDRSVRHTFSVFHAVRLKLSQYGSVGDDFVDGRDGPALAAYESRNLVGVEPLRDGVSPDACCRVVKDFANDFLAFGQDTKGLLVVRECQPSWLPTPHERGS